MTVERQSGVIIENNRVQEVKEINPITTALWVAGAIEVGGVVSFGIQRRKSGYVAAYPYLSFSDSNEQFVQNLKQRFGGSIPPSKPTVWRLSGYKAAELVASTKPYVVTRKEAALAMRNWLESDTAERVRIAEEMKGYDRFQEASAEDYRALIDQSAFVAGMVDNRGSIYPIVDNKGYKAVAIEIRSKNRPLLDALYKRFGGGITTQVEPGTPIQIHPNRKYFTKRASFTWRTTAAQARELIEFIQKDLQIPPFEGWEQMKIEEVRRGRSDIRTTIHAHARGEIERFKKGETYHISTADDIAAQFGLSGKTARRRLVEALPDELRKEREEILRGVNNAVLTPEQITQLVKQIETELGAFRQGQATRLTNNKKLAEQVGVGKHLVDRHIIPQLSQETRQARLDILRSQAAKDRNEKYSNPSRKDLK